MKTAFLISCTLLFSLAFQAQDFKVPKKIKLDKAEDYAEYEDEVLRAIEWLKNTPLTEQKAKRKKVNAFLLRWMTGTPDISITVDLRISPYAENGECIIMFMAGWAEYVLTKKDDSKTECAYAGTIAVLDFYKKNRAELGKIRSLKKLEKKRKKGELKAHIEKLTNP